MLRKAEMVYVLVSFSKLGKPKSADFYQKNNGRLTIVTMKKVHRIKRAIAIKLKSAERIAHAHFSQKRKRSTVAAAAAASSGRKLSLYASRKPFELLLCIAL